MAGGFGAGTQLKSEHAKEPAADFSVYITGLLVPLT